MSDQGKHKDESRREQPQTNKENFNKYLASETQITPV